MQKHGIYTESGPLQGAPYTPAVRVGSMIFVSGQIPLDPATSMVVEGGFEAQVRQCLRNLASILKQEGLGLDHVVKTTIFLSDLENFAELNRVYGSYFTGVKPARFNGTGCPIASRCPGGDRSDRRHRRSRLAGHFSASDPPEVTPARCAFQPKPAISAPKMISTRPQSRLSTSLTPGVKIGCRRPSIRRIAPIIRKNRPTGNLKSNILVFLYQKSRLTTTTTMSTTTARMTGRSYQTRCLSDSGRGVSE